MNKLRSLFLTIALLVATVSSIVAADQESYEGIIMNTDMIMNTRQSASGKIHSVKVLQLTGGVIRVVFNVELTKTDGTFEYEQYSQDLQPGADWYNQTVTEGKLLDIRE